MLKRKSSHQHHKSRCSWNFILLLSMTLLLMAMMVITTPFFKFTAHALSGDWPMFLEDNAHSGYNSAESSITVSTVDNLQLQWTYQTGGNISSQPIAANGQVYWGAWDGNEYATDLTGKLHWFASIGGQTQNCDTPSFFGVGSTATVASVSINGIPTEVVFVGGKDPKLNVASLYALDAATGAIIWETPLSSSFGSFSWSSPVLYNGSIYMGLSSVNDCPLVRGALIQMDASTGAIQNTFFTVPDGCVGGSIWSTPAIDETTGIVYITTGNNNYHDNPCLTTEIYAQSMIALNASDLSYVGSWQVPKSEYKGDSDFGASPTLFSATIGGTTHQMVGAVNKNGTFYAFDRTSLASGPLWRAKISSTPHNISAAAWDGTTLYVAGQNTTINGQSCKGSLRALDPATGNFLWESCLNDGVVFAPVSLVPGVAFVGEGAHLVAIATGTGQILFNYKTSATIQGAATISNGIVYVGNTSGDLYTFGLSTPPTPTPSPGTLLGQDTFQRSNQTYWGTASDGQFWGSSANNLVNFSINNNEGQILSNGTKNYGATLGLAATNAEVLYSGSLSSFGNSNMGAVLRWVDSSNFYKAYINGTNFILTKRVNGIPITIARIAFVATPGTSYTLRFNVVGNTLSARVWQIGTPEPTNWMISATDTTFAFGYCGLQMYLQSGVTTNITAFQATAQ